MTKENQLLAVFSVVRTQTENNTLERAINELNPLASPFIFKPVSCLPYDSFMKQDNVFIDVLWNDGTIGLEQSFKTLNTAMMAAWANTKVDIYASSLAGDNLLFMGLDFYFDISENGNDLSFDVCMAVGHDGNVCLFCELDLHYDIKDMIFKAWSDKELQLGKIYHCNLMQGKRPD